MGFCLGRLGWEVYAGTRDTFGKQKSCLKCVEVIENFGWLQDSVKALEEKSESQQRERERARNRCSYPCTRSLASL